MHKIDSEKIINKEYINGIFTKLIKIKYTIIQKNHIKNKDIETLILFRLRNSFITLTKFIIL